jgi:hypothetical protein
LLNNTYFFLRKYPGSSYNLSLRACSKSPNDCFLDLSLLEIVIDSPARYQNLAGESFTISSKEISQKSVDLEILKQALRLTNIDERRILYVSTGKGNYF